MAPAGPWRQRCIDAGICNLGSGSWIPGPCWTAGKMGASLPVLKSRADSLAWADGISSEYRLPAPSEPPRPLGEATAADHVSLSQRYLNPAPLLLVTRPATGHPCPHAPRLEWYSQSLQAWPCPAGSIKSLFPHIPASPCLPFPLPQVSPD